MEKGETDICEESEAERPTGSGFSLWLAAQILCVLMMTMMGEGYQNAIRQAPIRPGREAAQTAECARDGKLRRNNILRLVERCGVP